MEREARCLYRRHGARAKTRRDSRGNARWRPAPRSDIPGSVWLPGTGFGELAPETLRYFERGLARATANDKAKPLVFYCLANCWMSWNAAKRSLELGYTQVFWYPDGTDGWASANHPLEPREPEPREGGPALGDLEEFGFWA